jgi:putative transposase
MLAHSSALRWGRHSEPGTVYLITTVTQGRSAVFANFELARLVIAELRACDERSTCRTLAFVLMPDHLHWLVQLQGGELSALVGYFKAHAAKAVNRRRGVTGVPLWQHGFHDQALRREEDLAAMARYVVRNPVRAGLVKKTGDYPHWDAIWLS